METIFRVVCPDGHSSTSDIYRSVVAASAVAHKMDQLHDPSQCDGPHLIQVAEWETLTTGVND